MLLWSAYIFVNSLDLDQDQHNVGPDPEPNCLILSVKNSERIYPKKLNLEKNQWKKKNSRNYLA